MQASTCHVGVLLRRNGTRAALVDLSVPGGSDPVACSGPELAEVLAQTVDLAGVRPESVTVNLSPLLLDAVVGGRGLPPVATIRIVPRPFTDPSLARLPAPLVERLVAARYVVGGGHDLLGNELRPLDHRGLAETCGQLARSGVRHIGIVSAGSQARPAHELAVADAVQSAVPGARISIASEYGGQGLIAREATVVLDCVLAQLAEQLLDRCRQALAAASIDAALRVARGDAGYSTPSRILAMPVVALGGTAALELTGAAFLAGEPDCRVVLPEADGFLAGEVRHGLAVVGPTLLAELGAELVVPTALLTPQPGTVPGRQRTTEQPVVRPRHDRGTLACVGAAISRPTGWSDEVAVIESAARLDAVRQEAVERATAYVMANGAAPGTAYLVDVSAVALPYSPAGTVRVRVRVVGESDSGARQDEPVPGALP